MPIARRPIVAKLSHSNGDEHSPLATKLADLEASLARVREVAEDAVAAVVAQKKRGDALALQVDAMQKVFTNQQQQVTNAINRFEPNMSAMKRSAASSTACSS